jgi:hypothetical protein
MYAPYAVHAGDSGVHSSSARSTPHCALNATCILLSFAIASTVSAAATKSAYAEDLAAKRLVQQRALFRIDGEWENRNDYLPVCASVIFEVEIVLPESDMTVLVNIEQP